MKKSLWTMSTIPPQKQTEQPDLILMDIKMPVMDGTTALKPLKAQSETQHIPVVALTAFSPQQKQEKLEHLAQNCLKQVHHFAFEKAQQILADFPEQLVHWELLEPQMLTSYTANDHLHSNLSRE